MLGPTHIFRTESPEPSVQNLQNRLFKKVQCSSQTTGKRVSQVFFMPQDSIDEVCRGERDTATFKEIEGGIMNHAARYRPSSD